MSDSRYSYDEGGEAWPYFAATILGTVVIPVTVSRIWSLVAPNPATELTTSFGKSRPYNALGQQKYLASKRRGALFSTSTVFLLFGWGLLASIIYVIFTHEPEAQEVAHFDPWELLGISMSATAKEIKSAYRKLSVQFHPDKVRTLGNMTREAVESRFVDLTKAYKALTDEITIENFRLYGHPDGPQQTSHGIGLPAFLVGTASPIVLVIYGLFGVWGPYKLSRWWNNQMSRTRGGIKTSTATSFFEYGSKGQPLFATHESVLKEVLDRGEDDYREVVPHLTLQQRAELLEAHLNREAVKNEVDKLKTVEVTLNLLRGLLPIAEEFKVFNFVEKIVEVERHIVQAVPFKYQRVGSMLQIPGASLADANAGRPPVSSPAAVEEARKYIPSLHLLKASGYIPGMPTAIPGSKPFLILKFLVLPMGQKPPQIAKEELEEVVDASVSGRDLQALTDPLIRNRDGPKVPRTRSEYFPGNWTPSWHGYIVNERDPRFVSNPVVFENLDLSNLKLSTAELSSGDSVTIGTLAMSFFSPMPNQIGSVRFRLRVLSSGYFDCDINERITVELKNPPAPEPELGPAEDDEEEKEDQKGSDDEESDLSDIDTDTEDESELLEK